MYAQRIIQQGTLSYARVAMNQVLWLHAWYLSVGEGGNICSRLSELLKAMLKGNGRSARRLEYHMLQLTLLLTITPVLDD